MITPRTAWTSCIQRISLLQFPRICTFNMSLPTYLIRQFHHISDACNHTYHKSKNFRGSNIFKWPAGIWKLKGWKFSTPKYLQSFSNGDGVLICCVVALPLTHQDLSNSWIPCFYISGDLKYTILFIVPPSRASCVNNNRSSSWNFWMTCWFPKIFVHKNYKIKIL